MRRFPTSFGLEQPVENVVSKRVPQFQFSGGLFSLVTFVHVRSSVKREIGGKCNEVFLFTVGQSVICSFTPNPSFILQTEKFGDSRSLVSLQFKPYPVNLNISLNASGFMWNVAQTERTGLIEQHYHKCCCKCAMRLSCTCCHHRGSEKSNRFFHCVSCGTLN